MRTQATGGTARWLFLAALVTPVPIAGAHQPGTLRNPFTTLQQEQLLNPELLAQLDPWQAAQQIRQWRLHGVLGNRQRTLWGLIHRPPDKWRRIQVGEQWLGYQIVAIEPQRVLLQRLQTLPAADPGKTIMLPGIAFSPASVGERP